MREMSVVVPLYNEEGNVVELFQEIKAVYFKYGFKYEIIYVDDGSTDGTAGLCEALAQLVYVRLRRNFGQTAALRIKGFIDMISVWFWNKYGVRPLHLLGGVGMLFVILGAACALVTIIIFILRQDLSNTIWLLLRVFLVIMGIQLLNRDIHRHAPLRRKSSGRKA
jgi:GT2 family glycosyltransferase